MSEWFSAQNGVCENNHHQHLPHPHTRERRGKLLTIPVSISYSIVPKLHQSTSYEYGKPWMTSGARYSAVPQNVLVWSVWRAPSAAPSSVIQYGTGGAPLPFAAPGRERGNSLLRPKSVNLRWPRESISKLSGLRSLDEKKKKCQKFKIKIPKTTDQK